ncbi:MAG: protoporphyrinogen oxidase [Acidobacteriaceae bacterium]|nr:protoporphyrinogen oxidase [Acidobacteriaceae bacterium]
MSSTASPSSAQVVIVGGGISGLAIAFYLSKSGIRPILIEKSQLGGLIRTDVIDGCELEAGPDSFLAAKTSVGELAAELGLTGEIIGSNDEQRRIFIARDRKLVPLPPGMVMMTPGDLKAALRSNFFSPTSKIRFIEELFARPKNRPGDVSVREFVTDHFSREILEYVTEPLLAGVYGGDAMTLSARSVLPRFVDYEERYGSLIRGVRKEREKTAKTNSLFLSFRHGMQTLIDALTREIADGTELVNAEVMSVEKMPAGWQVRTQNRAIAAEHVVLACPAHVAAKLIANAAPRAAGNLAAIPYSSAILINLVYDSGKLRRSLDGFGLLVPRQERRTIAAATWVSTKFPSRTPPDRAAVRAFIVGDKADDLISKPDAERIFLVREEFRNLLGIDSTPLIATVQRWPHSMPQYVVGHRERVRGINEAVQASPGLHLCGNAYEGVGIPDCVRLAQAVSCRIARQVGR